MAPTPFPRRPGRSLPRTRLTVEFLATTAPHLASELVATAGARVAYRLRPEAEAFWLTQVKAAPVRSSKIATDRRYSGFMQPSPSTELRLSAKELRYVGSRLVQSQEVADRLVGAANWTLLQAEAPGLQKLLETLLDLCGGVTIAMLSAEDEPVLFVPVSVIRNGKEELGAVTTLVDRVIVAWTEGTFRLTYCGSAISVADVRNVEMTAGDFDIELRATTDSTEWHLRFSRRHTTVDEETNLTQFVVNTLSGKALAEEKGQANDPDVTPSGSAAVSDDEPTDGSASIGG